MPEEPTLVAVLAAITETRRHIESTITLRMQEVRLSIRDLDARIASQEAKQDLGSAQIRHELTELRADLRQLWTEHMAHSHPDDV